MNRDCTFGSLFESPDLWNVDWGDRLVDVDWRWGENRAGRPPPAFWDGFKSGSSRADPQWESNLRWVIANDCVIEFQVQSH